jgi:5-formyltetrahydrofolate cyclo-ligase
MFKDEARKSLLQKRQNLSQTECVKWDDLLLIQFQKLEFSNIQTIGSFYPMEKHNEPNTILLTSYLQQFIPDLIIAYPVIDKASETMHFYEATDELFLNAMGIYEPNQNKLIPSNEIDCLLVPLLGFDLLGQRLGFGKGYYDKYFSTCQNPYQRIGISYFEPIPNIQDTHEFDVPLTHCITPWNSYEFK